MMTRGSDMGKPKICPATTADEEHIRALLAGAQLPHEDIHEHLRNFLVAKQNNAVVGAVGLEMYDRLALLRSLVVTSSYQGKGLGRMLYDRIVAYARLHGVREVYLLTTTADRLFRKQGFVQVDKKQLPAVIKETNEFKHLCPASAVCMTKRIDNEVFHVPKGLLHCESIIAGANMWAVSLDKVMFTYFEIEPGARFERHRHESEQITYVLEGELFFELADKTECVGSGGVIAIPSNIPHAAYTKKKRVRAVDAWSPVRDEFVK
jgi:amino-acid N-acetyltransferase